MALIERTEEITLPPVRPSAAIEAKYRRRLQQIIVEMNNDVIAEIKKQWRKNTPEMAHDERTIKTAPAWQVPSGFTGVVSGFTTGGRDRRTYAIYINGVPLRGGGGVTSSQVRRFASHQAAAEALENFLDEQPADTLDDAVKRLRSRWEEKFDKLAETFSEHFSAEVEDRVSSTLRRAMKDAGWSIKKDLFANMTPASMDVVRASINQSVGLIKSIPAKYFDQVASDVQRSVQYGGDLSRLSKDLQKNYGVSKRRAEFIARDQNNKATAAITTARQRQLGIKEAIWVHSSAGKTPRPTHVRNNGKKYDVSKGWYDPAERRHIHPGELINCRCFSRSVIPGFA